MECITYAYIFEEKGKKKKNYLWKMCSDPTNWRDCVLWPNKMTTDYVLAQHFVLQPISQGIYDRSLDIENPDGFFSKFSETFLVPFLGEIC